MASIAQGRGDKVEYVFNTFSLSLKIRSQNVTQYQNKK
jgi:hypothetical protein